VSLRRRRLYEALTGVVGVELVGLKMDMNECEFFNIKNRDKKKRGSKRGRGK